VKWAIFGALSVVATVATSHPVNESFLHLRHSLIQQGWKPFKFDRKSLTDYPVDTDEEMLIKAKITEVESCSVDAGRLCRFWYTRSGACLMVVAKGEKLKSMKTVFSGHDQCPEK